MESSKNKIFLFDFGGQSAHLISRRVKQFGFDVKIVGSNYRIKEIQDLAGIILSGGARSVYEKNAPKFHKELFSFGVPILGICYGHQLIAHVLGGKVEKGTDGEYGPSKLNTGKSYLFKGLPSSFTVWMNHRDSVVSLPKGFGVIGKTKTTKIAAYENPELKISSVQFHPEVSHTEGGDQIIKNFLNQISKTTSNKAIEAQSFINEARIVLGKDKAIIGLSGGVDSAVAAILVSRAIGKNLLAVYVDTGFMRSGETEQIRQTFSKFPLKLKVVNASALYYSRLKGIKDPEQKRKIIGKLFIDVFNKEAKSFGANCLIQGTIYSDRIESGFTKHSSKIKSHHNVGGLPKDIKLRVYEPLRELYKDEVRELARKLKLPNEISHRQVFPGPGLAIRVIGDLMPEKVDIVRRADTIIQDELRKANLIKKIWMAFPVLLSIKSVGIQGDERTYKYPLVLRIVQSKDAITANFARIPYEVLEKISTRITNEIREVNRVVYDISNKPPATMEWE
jgi:GMP synthase (glutamine-hydrolysing)